MGGRGPTAQIQAALVGSGALLTTAYLLLPSTAVRVGAWATLGVVSALAILLVTHRAKPQDRLPSWLLAAGIALVGVGYAVSLAGPTTPSYADLPLLLAYAVLAGAVTAFQRDRIRHDRDSLLDALVVTVAAAQVGWMALIDPVLNDSDADLLSSLTAGAFPLGHLLVLAVATRLGFAVVGSADGSARLLLAALFTGVASGLAADITNRPELAAGWFVAFALVVLATTDPTMTRPRPVTGSVRLATAWRFVVLLGLACLVSPVIIVTRPPGNGLFQSAVILGGAVMLFVLALLRIISLLTRLRRTLRREHVLRTATGPLVGAADRDGVRDAALTAAVDLLDQAGSRSWRIDGDPGGTVAQATEDADLATFLDSAELELFPQHEQGIDVLAGPSLLHATLGVPSTWSLVLVALPARGPAREGAVIAVELPPSPRTVSALQSLASTMHLALERLDVGEIMVERRSERRLRLMLQYASDVICILDHDLTIVHVTPAVEPIVGLPAPELLGMNWLDIVTATDRDSARDLVSLAQGGRPARGEIRLEQRGRQHPPRRRRRHRGDRRGPDGLRRHLPRHHRPAPARGAAHPPGVPRRADRAREPRAVPRPARPRDGPGPRQRRLRRAVHRPRRLQDGQRQPRARRRRRPAARDDRPAARSACATATPRPGSAATSSPSCSRTSTATTTAQTSPAGCSRRWPGRSRSAAPRSPPAPASASRSARPDPRRPRT